MANLKIDLVNKLNNDKFHAELELVRLAQKPDMNYKVKLTEMDTQLNELALTNIKLSLVEQYFQEPAPSSEAQQGSVPQQGSAPQQVPQGNVHPGQSHGEG